MVSAFTPFVTDFTPLETNSYQANLYPTSSSTSDASAPVFGVCFSGGGSRALSCALGQLSGLRSLPDPNNRSQTLLDRVQYLSSVSGGSWASVLFTFLPQTIGGKPVSDDDFLIFPQAPGSLFKDNPSVKKRQNVSHMPPFCLGNVPAQFSVDNIANLLIKLYNWGLFGSTAKRSWWWIAAVGELVLKPFDLYDAYYDPNVNYPQPSLFFSLSNSYVTSKIQPTNPSLDPTQFYTARAKRPGLFVNTNLLQNYEDPSSAQIPIQATPIDSGALGQSPDGTIVGGGSAESFAFTSTLVGKGKSAGLASVTADRRYSLCDIAGCSSAFFASTLLNYINTVILDDLLDEIAAYLKEQGWSEGAIKALIGIISFFLQYLVDEGAAEIIPQYNYWTIGDVGQSPPTNTTYGFSDGGDFDDTGVLGLLARTGASRILSFVNGETPLSRDASSKQIIVDGQLALLFGYQTNPVGGQYVSYGGMNPKQPMSYVQVFSDANGEFAALRQGLFSASTGGSNKDSDLGTNTAAFVQTLTTVDNPVADIAGGRQVKVLWVYNNRVNKWQNAVGNATIQADLQQGQSANPSGPLANFPHYDTGLQIELDAEAVNMLAQLSAWNVQQLQSQINQLLT